MFRQIKTSQFSLNKTYQIIFCFFIFFTTIFNASNSFLLIKINFVILLFFFIFLILDKKYKKNFIYSIKSNKKIFVLFVVFIFYLIFQIIPLPNHFLNLISENSYNFYYGINLKKYNPVTLNVYFSIHEIISYLNIFFIVVLTNLIFYKKKHTNRYFIYFSIIGFIHAFFAVFWLLIGNPEFLFKETMYYSNSATGFFINRTNFAFFLVLTFLISLNYLFFNYKKTIPTENNFNIIYVRIFILFISIGIISTFSRLGNLYLLFSILFYFILTLKNQKNFLNQFSLFFIVLILFDILVMGLYFGGNQLISRFDFFNYELLSNIENKNSISGNIETTNNLSRINLILLSLNFFKSFPYFGYGAGSFEPAFFLLFENIQNVYANHAHSDFVELLGEIGIFGFLIFLLIFVNIIIKGVHTFKNKTNNAYVLLIPLLIIFLFNGFFDFSLNIPSNQFLFASLVSFSLKKYL